MRSTPISESTAMMTRFGNIPPRQRATAQVICLSMITKTSANPFSINIRRLLVPAVKFISVHNSELSSAMVQRWSSGRASLSMAHGKRLCDSVYAMITEKEIVVSGGVVRIAKLRHEWFDFLQDPLRAIRTMTRAKGADLFTFLGDLNDEGTGYPF